MREVEALIVGAGPAGSTVARRLAERAHHVLVLEEHDRIGQPVQCAGLVSQRVLDLAGPDGYRIGPVLGATVFGPGRPSVKFRAEGSRAFVIDRAGLDRHLADRAARAGAEFEVGSKFDRLVGFEGDAPVAEIVRSDGVRSRVRAKVIIGADGVTSAVARAFRLRRPVEILPAFEAEFPSEGGDPQEVEVYLGRTIAPGLFGWSIPDQSGGARVGVAANADGTSARIYFERLVERIGKVRGRRLRSPTSFIVSGIPIGRLPRTSARGVMLVGDAAAQVKPLSGGGIYTGMRCAEIAAEVAHSALGAQDLGASSLARYDVRWREELGGEFDRAMYLRRLFVRLTDRELDAIVGSLDRAELRGTIVAFGDIDFPSGVARALLVQSPSLMRLFPKALGALVGSPGVHLRDLDPGPRRYET
ncbi:MAG TPA: NAD(P)/FAD-dependent oxidoreductase [Thermoplasmata archaeon]|nr:NAD(P)/FAD-dependent oxidoreductase [Thermoplasmata archaeon]